MKESFSIEDRYLRSPNDVLRIALAWHENGKEIALATVIGTWGSSPRPIGSNLVIAKNGEFEGSVSGGCVEGAVISAAKEVIETGQQQLLKFGVTNDEAWEVGLACGAEIEVLLEKVR